MSQLEGKIEVAIVEMPSQEVSGFTAATDVLHASVAETTAFTGADRDFSKWKRALFVCDLTAITGTSVTFNVQIKDPLSGKYMTLISSSALAAATTSWIFIDESTTAPAAQAGHEFKFSGHYIPSTTFRLTTTLVAVTSYTFSAYVILFPA